MNINKLFDKDNLKNKYLKELFNSFWFVPCDAFLRAPEVAIWKGIEFKTPVLNIGCGDGRMDKYLFKGKSIDIAIDYDKKAIEYAKTSGLYKRTILASASKMPFKDKSFSTVVSNSTFEHIKRDLVAVKEVYRVLKKGGRFIFTTTNDRFPETLLNLGLNKFKLRKYNKRVSHFHYRNENEWQCILKDVGFSSIYTRSYDPDEWMKIWLRLFLLYTMKPYKRELWSYLRDSPYGMLFPKNVISKLMYFLFRNKYRLAFKEPGNWLFLYAEK